MMNNETKTTINPITNIIRIVLCDDNPRQIQIINNLSDLTVTGLTLWIDSVKTPASILSADKNIPFLFFLGEKLQLETEKDINQSVDMKVEITTLETGRLLTGNQISQSDKPIANHPWKLSQIFSQNYSEDLLINANDVLGRRENLQMGATFSGFESTAEKHFWLDSEINTFRPELIAALREISPKTLGYRLPIATENSQFEEHFFNAFLHACKTLESSPHIQIPIQDTTETDGLVNIVQQTIGQVPGETWWSPVYWIDFSVKDWYENDLTLNDTRISHLKELSDALHRLNPLIKIILSGAIPDTGSAISWNEKLVAACADFIDAFGIQWIYPGPKGWFQGKPNFAMEMATGLSGAFNQAINSTLMMLQSASPDKIIPLAVSPWTFFKAPAGNSESYQTESSKQDIFYQAAIINHLLRNADRICLAEYGPVIGDAGFICHKDETIWRSADFYLQIMIKDVENTILRVKSFRDKELQTYEWSGISGLIDSRTITYVDILASRSNDASRIDLIVLNRHHRKRAMVRVNFPDFSEMRPLGARSLRSGKWTYHNSAENPEAVHCATISMRKYKQMDHVNLDLPPCGIISMTLSSGLD